MHGSGEHFFLEPNVTLDRVCTQHPLDYPPSNAVLDISHPYFPLRRRKYPFLQLKPSFAVAGGYGHAEGVYKQMADRRRTPYRLGQRVMLSTGNLPLQVESHKLAPRFVGPFPISRIINPTTVCLSLPLSLHRVHPSFHVSQLRPLVSCRLFPPPKDPLPLGALHFRGSQPVSRVIF